ncbi:hypothetical protein Lfu02_27700 [Longispora fulva]|uniref:Uncharacterized protein n=1 Tax=Longispora fulva TaxID=619741 RepID=A0A8J7GR41_9ACTN|nr:hypothetical protein [Longispora fulva]MBG6138905.1 hypothetical protein [Longispora fulva]GIG58398.1 hypothetical protein Lfu02_27700 [Longispora fulva]
MPGPYGYPRTEAPPTDDAIGWITGRLPEDWFVGLQISIDRDEILIVGQLPEPTLPEDATEIDKAAAEAGRIERFREPTRDHRIKLAQQIEHRYRRKCSWGATCGDTKELFTTLSAPVMSRLKQKDRLVLDTLVNAGVARSRSEALAWCVRLVGEHANEWLSDLRGAMESVDELRRKGPDL